MAFTSFGLLSVGFPTDAIATGLRSLVMKFEARVSRRYEHGSAEGVPLQISHPEELAHVMCE